MRIVLYCMAAYTRSVKTDENGLKDLFIGPNRSCVGPVGQLSFGQKC